MPALHETRMGSKFFEVTLPRIAAALERIAASLEKLASKTAAAEQEEKGEYGESDLRQ